MLPGVYLGKKKDNSIYYRASFHGKNRHISLGSFDSEKDAHQAYLEAKQLFYGTTPLENALTANHVLAFDKIVSIINFRDHKLYIKTPIYLQQGYFIYYLSENETLKFDNDDLFYYSSHKIQKRNGHLFVSDYGMQYSILSRYGIKSYAVAGRDYDFANGDATDLRYSNIYIINKYHGVSRVTQGTKTKYVAKIHLNGDFIVGYYSSEPKAAVAYNKAVDYARDHGFVKNFIENYVTEYTPKEYADVYTSISISKRLKSYIKNIT